jgi:uncharacterized membrane protein
MITKAERRFITQWMEQRSGPRWKYYFQYIIGWTIISFLVTFFLFKLFTNAWENGGEDFIYILTGFSIIAGFLITHFTYVISEKKFKKILEREQKH